MFCNVSVHLSDDVYAVVELLPGKEGVEVGQQDGELAGAVAVRDYDGHGVAGAAASRPAGSCTTDVNSFICTTSARPAAPRGWRREWRPARARPAPPPPGPAAGSASPRTAARWSWPGRPGEPGWPGSQPGVLAFFMVNNDACDNPNLGDEVEPDSVAGGAEPEADQPAVAGQQEEDQEDGEEEEQPRLPVHCRVNSQHRHQCDQK